MGDDDVICLSSDDEVAHDESTRKKEKINYAPLTAKIEPKDTRKDTILCYLKRKSPEDDNKSINNVIEKKKKVETVIEEILIESPIKSQLSRPSTTIIGDYINELSADLRREKLENGTIAINKIPSKKSMDSSQLIDQPKSSYSQAKIPISRNDSQLENNNSKESNRKNVNSSKTQNTARSNFQKSDRLLNPVAKLKEAAAYRSSSSQILHTNHHLNNGNNKTDAKCANENMNFVALRIEKSKSPSLSSKSGNETVTNRAKPENNVITVEKPIAAANETDKQLDRTISPHKIPENFLKIVGSLITPEVVIIPGAADTPKASTVASDKTPTKVLSINSRNNALKCDEKNVAYTEHGINGSAQSGENLHHSSVTNSEILNVKPDEEDIIVTKMTDSRIGEPEKALITSRTSDSNILIKNKDTPLKRIKPQKISDTRSNNQSHSETEKASKLVKNSTTHTSKVSDDINGREKSVSNDGKNSNVKNDHSSNNNLMSSCWKARENDQSSSLKRKSTSPEIVEKAKKTNDDAPYFEPQPGCSKSPDEIIMDGKPCLVVFDKKPVSLETEDTFSMFLSLCLQTDRSPDMEKVVAKLKRYYEQLNPAYAASQAFRDTLNEKRDLIIRKGKKVVYHYVQLLKEDMKAKKKKIMPVGKVKGNEDAAEQDEQIIVAGQAEDEEDNEEARRVRHKIKRIEKAMKECQKMIKKYESTEINFDDDNNSNYIKLDRFKERMVQLYTQMCKYTEEHPDAGRAYLRPKHLRVTQIPSIDQAINSFINSKLSVNKYKVTKGKSFVDGLIFPDYVDILECVEKVNTEQNMKLGKRDMQNLAEKAFTQLGKHLQEARQNDYWDTFSLNLDNNVDPATSDSDLLEKLARNRTIAEENERKVFQEFVRRQEEGKIDDKDDSVSEVEDEDDADDQEQRDEQEDNDNKSNRNDESDEEMSIGDDNDRESVKENDEDNTPETDESISGHPEAEGEECAVEDNAEHISKKNNIEASDSMANKNSTSPALSPEDSAGTETMMTEVILDDVETEDGENKPREEEKLRQPLRIRSFAKPPDSWQCSQEAKEEKNEDNTTKPEKLEDTEQEISVVSVLPGRDKIVKSLTTNSKRIVGIPLNNITKKIPVSPTAQSNRPTSNLLFNASTSSNTTNGQNLKYITIAPGVTRPVQLPRSRVQNNVKPTQILAASRAPQPQSTNTGQVRLGIGTATTSTPVQRPPLQKNSRMASQQTNKFQVLRLSNGKCVSATIGSRLPNTPRFVSITSNPTSIRSMQLAPGTVSSIPQFRPAQILPGSNTGLLLNRPQVPSPPRNSVNFSRDVSLTSTPVQRLQQNKLKVTANYSAAQSSQVPQVLRINNGKYIMSSSTENSRISQQVQQNASQQQQKGSNVAVPPVKSVNVAGSTTLPVLKPRINDNVRTVQQQKTNVRRPGDQNRQTSEGETKRKNQLL